MVGKEWINAYGTILKKFLFGGKKESFRVKYFDGLRIIHFGIKHLGSH